MSRSRMWLKNRHQEQIVRLLEQLGAGKLSIWEIWEDFILMSAISIANSVDFGPAQAEREQLYTSISAKYTADEFGLFVEAFSQVVLGLETDPQQDLLGTVFMSLGLNDHWKGQFFTPYNIAKMMAEMTLSDRLKEKIEANGWISVYDPACGAGALLVAFANACRTQKPSINFQTSVLFAAQDVDRLAACMCYIQLSLLGCPGYIVVDNSLTQPLSGVSPLLQKQGSSVWFTPAFFFPRWQERRAIEQLRLEMGRVDIPPADGGLEVI